MASTQSKTILFGLAGLVGLIIIVAILFALGLVFGEPRGGSDIGDDVEGNLVVWGLWQESADVQPVLNAFEEQTGVAVEYRKIASVADYENRLLEALAQGRGPDVFVIHHTWVEGKRGIMAPAPSEVVTPRDVQNEFVSVVNTDLVRDGQVYALPTSVDTMALYYNEQLLSAAGVAQPPRTWQDFQRAVQQITEISRLGVLEQSAAAIGTAENVNRAPDIVQLLMIQSGGQIADQNGTVDIAGDIGQRALTFYTDFSNKSKQVYTWNLQQDFSIDAFAEEETAMMFNYAYNIPTVKAKNPRLDFRIAPMPQIADSTPVTFANYWPFAVSNTSSSPRAAWEFVRFMTSRAQSSQINNSQGVPPARRDAIDTVRNDPELGVFAEQALNARTWPRVDVVRTDAIFNRMIDDVVTGGATIEDAASRAEDQVRKMIREAGSS